jgi:biopolymer transport protein ExbB
LAQDTPSSAFDHFLLDGGPITYVVLLPLSLATIALSIDYFIRIRRSTIVPAELVDQLTSHLEEQRYREVLETSDAHDSLLGEVVHSGLTHASGGAAAMDQAMEGVLEQRAAALFRRIEYLNIIGNISPMIGLFGTVFGMIRTFSEIVAKSGQPSAQDLAAGISIALVTTFWGLLVAVPALTVFHVMRNRIDGLLAECAQQAEDLMATVRSTPTDPSERPGQRGRTAVATSA